MSGIINSAVFFAILFEVFWATMSMNGFSLEVKSENSYSIRDSKLQTGSAPSAVFQTESQSATLPDDDTIVEEEQTGSSQQSKSSTTSVSKTAGEEAPEFTFSIASPMPGRSGKQHMIKNNLERTITRLRERLAALEEDLVVSGILDKIKLIETMVSNIMTGKQFGKLVPFVLPPCPKPLPKQCTDIANRIRELDKIVEDHKKIIDVIGNAGETPQDADEACEENEVLTTTTATTTMAATTATTATTTTTPTTSTSTTTTSSTTMTATTTTTTTTTNPPPPTTTTTTTTNTTSTTTTPTTTTTKNSEECTMSAYTHGHQTRFSDRIYSGFFNNGTINDASGIALSNIHDDTMYVITDYSSTSNGIYIHVVSAKTGTYKSAVHVDGAVNHDCEDLAVAPCPGETMSSCIYIADTGHAHGETINDIYIVPEPKDPEISTTVKYKHKISFSFSSSGIETLLVSPDSRMFVIPTTAKYTGTQLLEVYMDGTIDMLCDIKFYSKHFGPVSGDIDPSGEMVLVKTDEYVYFYYIPGGKYDEVICDESKQIRLAYSEESDGQSIAFSPDSLSYYTCSETSYTAVWRYDRLRVA